MKYSAAEWSLVLFHDQTPSFQNPIKNTITLKASIERLCSVSTNAPDKSPFVARHQPFCARCLFFNCNYNSAILILTLITPKSRGKMQVVCCETILWSCVSVTKWKVELDSLPGLQQSPPLRDWTARRTQSTSCSRGSSTN